MKNFRLTRALICVLLLLCTALSLVGCTLPGGTQTPTYNVTGGDTNNVTVNVGKDDAAPVAASKALMSAVSIYSAFSSKSGAYGSGFIYKMSEDRRSAYVVTNYHVIYMAGAGVSKSISVFLYGQQTSACAIEAEFIGGSMNYDLAVLKITNSQRLFESEAMAAQLANSDEVDVLDTVIAVGNAGGAGLSATAGNVNVISEYISLLAPDERTKITLRVMRTDAAVNPGNSGGGLFDTEGKVVGVVNAKSTEDTVDNMGYAIPSNVAKNIVENIIYYCDGTEKTCVYRIILGVDLENKSPKADYNPETGKITLTSEVAVSSIDSTSVLSGKLAVGDVITAVTVDGVRIEANMRHTVIDHMLNARAGSTVVFEYVRGGKAASVTVTPTESMLTPYV